MKDTARRCMTHYVHERLVTQAGNTQDGRQQSEDSKEKRERRREKRKKRREKREERGENREDSCMNIFFWPRGTAPAKEEGGETKEKKEREERERDKRE